MERRIHGAERRWSVEDIQYINERDDPKYSSTLHGRSAPQEEPWSGAAMERSGDGA